MECAPHSLLIPSSLLFSLPLKIFGCICYVHNLVPSFDKFDPRVANVFLGYSHTQKGYRCHSPILRKHFTSSDVTFFESTPYFSNVSTPDVYNLEMNTSLISLTIPSLHNPI